MKNIEVEFFAQFNKEKYHRLFSFLRKNAKNLNKDDKNNWFFLFPNKNLKVVKEISKKTAKIVLKMNKIGLANSGEEIEIKIDQKDAEKMVKIFKELGCNKIIHTFTKRHNFKYKGVEIALKYSEDWGYHLELEIMIKDKSKQPQAEAKIQKIANELGVNLLTSDQLKQIVIEIEGKYGYI